MKRAALTSDIQGNAVALGAVLADADVAVAVELRRVPVDIRALERAGRASGMRIRSGGRPGSDDGSLGATRRQLRTMGRAKRIWSRPREWGARRRSDARDAARGPSCLDTTPVAPGGNEKRKPSRSAAMS
jgi:hypothetical protein